MKTLFVLNRWAVLFLFCCPISLFSQQIEGGLLLGLNNYIGDFVPSKFEVSETHPSYGLFIRTQFHKNLSFRFNFLAGKISGDDRNYAINETRGHSFTTTLLEGSAQVEWNIFVLSFKDQKGNIIKTFQPYLFAGIGAVYFDSTMSGMSANAPDYHAEFMPVQATFPLGAGLQWQYHNGLSLSLEAGARLTNTDYLDGVSAWGSPDQNDWYAFGGVTIGFLLK